MRKLAKLAALAVSAVMTLSMAFAGDITFVSDPISESAIWGAGANKETKAQKIDLTGIDAASIDKVVCETVSSRGGKLGLVWGEGDANQAPCELSPKDSEDISKGWTQNFEFTGLSGKIKDSLEIQNWWINSADAEEGAEGAFKATFDWGTAVRKAGSFKITAIKMYDKDGKELVATAPEKPADKPATDPNNQTGDATSVIALGAVALLALAGVAYTKKNA